MKRISFVFVFVVCSIVAISQSQYNITFDDTDFIYVETNGAYKVLTENSDYYFINDTSSPALPYKNIYILIPENATLENVNYYIRTKEILNNALLEKNDIEYPSNSDVGKNNVNFDYSEVIYPSTNLQFETVIKIQGFYIAAFSVCPFLYNTENRSLRFITDIDLYFSVNVKIETTKPSSCSNRYDMKNIVERLVINSQEINKIYPNASNNEFRTNSNNIDYLIITNENLKSSYIPLKAWKIRKGVKTDILTTDYIYSRYAGSNNQLKIKNCIYDYYQNKGLKWVLLGGDNTIIPVQACFCTVGSPYIDEEIPCDMFYSCFDNAFDWDANNNAIIGEITDNIDMAPDVYISRVPVRDINQVAVFVDKTMKYETMPEISINANTMLLSGAYLHSYFGSLSDAHYYGEQMYLNKIQPYWSGAMSKFYDTGTDFAGDSSYDLTASNYQTVFNNGYHFVHMATHGADDAWNMETGNSYYSSNASLQTNSKQSIIITSACNTNAFDSPKDPCLSEALLRNPNGGCVLYWGSSSLGWSPHSRYLCERFYYYLFSEGQLYDYKFSALTTASKSYYISSSSSYSSYRWLQMSQNAMGDPEMTIFTDNPMEFTNATVSMSGTTVLVSTGGVTDCTIALTSMDLGESYFSVEKGVSSAIFLDVSVPYYVTITKHNYKPYQYSTDIYIQNEDIAIDKNYKGRNIYVGNNVTSSIIYGDVFIEDSINVILEADEDVYIEGGFEIGATGSMEIR